MKALELACTTCKAVVGLYCNLSIDSANTIGSYHKTRVFAAKKAEQEKNLDRAREAQQKENSNAK